MLEEPEKDMCYKSTEIPQVGRFTLGFLCGMLQQRDARSWEDGGCHHPEMGHPACSLFGPGQPPGKATTGDRLD